MITTVPIATWLAAGRAVSLASLGGAAGERLQILAATAIAWAEANATLQAATDAAHAAIQGPRLRFNAAKDALDEATAAETSAKEELLKIARALSAWAEASKEPAPSSVPTGDFVCDVCHSKIRGPLGADCPFEHWPVGHAIASQGRL